MKPQPRYQPGDRIGGRYQVHRALMGGMGVLYFCWDLQEDYPWVLKTFQQRYISDQLRNAFYEEVGIWVALERHPNIVRCSHMDIIEDQPFLFLEWILGDKKMGLTLRDWLQYGALDLQQALDFAIDVCRGLVHAQKKQPGIVHRDLKPENILINQEHIAQITDFGLARVVQRANLQPDTTEGHELSENHLQNIGGIVGTPPYMPPEQWRGEALDARSDIYAVGCILFEMLAGRRPFAATRLNEWRDRHQHAPIPKLADSFPSRLNTSLKRCLAKNVQQRFGTADELLEELTGIHENLFGPPRELVSVREFKAIDYTNRGVTYANIGRHEEALADYAKAIAIDPSYTNAYYNRGLTYMELRLYEKALADFDQTITLDPNREEAHRCRASIFLLWEKGSTAGLAVLTAAISGDPENIYPYLQRGYIYKKLQRYEDALTNFSQVIALDPKYKEAYFARGQINSDLQHFEQALADFTQVIKLDAEHREAHFNRGYAYNELGQYEKALADYTKSIVLEREFYEKALADYPELLDRIDQFPIGTNAYANRGYTYDKLGRYQEALADYTKSLEHDPNNARVYTSRGNTYSRLKRYGEALADHSKAISFDPGNAEAYANRGHVYYQMERYQDALADEGRAIELNPRNAQAYFNRGLTYDKLYRDAEALADFTEAARLDPKWGEAHYNRGASLANMRRFPEALTAFLQAAEAGHAQGMQAAMRIQRMLGMPPSAVPVDQGPETLDASQDAAITHDVLQATKPFPSMADLLSARMYNDRGNICYKRGEYEDALTNYSRALELDPSLAEAYNNRGVVYTMQRQYRKALADFDHAIELDSQYESAFYHRGLTYTNLGQHAKALADFDRAIQLDPAAAQTFFIRGTVYFKLQRFEDALVDYSQAIQLGLDNASVYLERAHIYFTLQRYDEAISDYEQAIRLDPTLTIAYRNLGMIFVQRGDFKQALPHCKKAAELGDVEAKQAIPQIEYTYQVASALQVTPKQLQFALQAIQKVDSLHGMQHVVARFPFTGSIKYIRSFEKFIDQYAPIETREFLRQRLAWLRQIASEQK